ncbi:MAG: aldehyde dehydrogenase family protein, partial [Cytophagales bacterium]|nr:aldehyde dehydrogenase family protein [Cytophagales bacterium]
MVTRELGKDEIKEILERQKIFFRSGETLKLKFRLKLLRNLYLALSSHEDAIFEALYLDFKKSKFEAFGTEIALVREEIKYFIKRLPGLVKPTRVKSSLASLPSKSFVYYEPFGQSLIIGPWNYPVMLIFQPLVGSLAAGNCVILKPSELAANTSRVVKRIID